MIRRATPQIVAGSARERAALYCKGAFFTICNYEQVLRDMLVIEQVRWDLILLDEGQRIKNWQAKTTRMIKALGNAAGEPAGRAVLGGAVH